MWCRLPGMTSERNLTAAIFGSSTAEPHHSCYRLAHDLAAGLAGLGITVKNGGYDGVMAAASQGAREAGGHVIGVTVARLNGVRPPNRWLTENVGEDDILARLRRLVEGTDIYYAIESGGPGTLNEVFLVWAMMMIGDLGDRPLVLVGAGWPELMATLGAHFDMGRDATRVIRLAPDVPSALAEARALPRAGR